MHRETKERMCRASSIWCCEPEVFWGHHTPFEFQIAGAYIPGCLQPFTLCRGSPKLLIKYKMFNFNKGKGETVLRWIYLSTWSWDWFKNSFKSSYRLGEVNIDHTACWRSITNGWIASVGILDVVTGQQMGFLKWKFALGKSLQLVIRHSAWAWWLVCFLQLVYSQLLSQTQQHCPLFVFI
jgi:hypothetical protein